MYFHTSQLLCKLYSENMIFLSFTATTIQLNCRYLMVWCSLLALKVLLNPDQPTLVVQILVSFRLLLIVTKCVGTVWCLAVLSTYVCVIDSLVRAQLLQTSTLLSNQHLSLSCQLPLARRSQNSTQRPIYRYAILLRLRAVCVFWEKSAYSSSSSSWECVCAINHKVTHCSVIEVG